MQVERGVETPSANECAGARSWLKSTGRVSGNRSVDRRVFCRSPAPSVRSRTAPDAPSATCCSFLGRFLAHRARREPLGAPQQGPARRCHRCQAEGRPCRARQGRPVPDEHHGDQYAAEGRPAHHIAHGVADGVLRGGPPGGGLGCGHGGPPWTVAWACLERWLIGVQRLFDRPVTESAPRVVARPPPSPPKRDRTAGANRSTAAPRLSKPRANSLYGAATIALRAPSRACSLEPSRGRRGIWAEEACRRTLGGMGLGRRFPDTAP